MLREGTNGFAAWTCSVDACGDFFAVGAFAFTEAVVHQAVAQPHSIFGLGEDHG